MTIHTGYLLIADISGYTEYLTTSELDHANPILSSLLNALVKQIGDPMKLWKTEGDAVLAYSADSEFPSGETFLEICENLYNSFAKHQRNIIANTTCTCRACANVNGLDLKIVAHFGQFEEIEIGPVRDISGADVILVHRMAKTNVAEATGIHSYALFSSAAVRAMDIQTALTPYSETFDHFGETPMQVYNLAEAWDGFRAKQERFFLKEEDGVFTYRRKFNFTKALVWQALVAPEIKQEWMENMNAVTVDRPEGRIGSGSGYHCAHRDIDFYYWVTDWEPFNYFSTLAGDPLHQGLYSRETYQLVSKDDGTELRYTLGPTLDEKGKHYEEEQAVVVNFLAQFWPPSFDKMEEMLNSR